MAMNAQKFRSASTRKAMAQNGSLSPNNKCIVCGRLFHNESHPNYKPGEDDRNGRKPVLCVRCGNFYHKLPKAIFFEGGCYIAALMKFCFESTGRLDCYQTPKGYYKWTPNAWKDQDHATDNLTGQIRRLDKDGWKRVDNFVITRYGVPTKVPAVLKLMPLPEN